MYGMSSTPENMDNSMAANADRHILYQESVQDVDTEIDFVFDTWAALRDRPATLLREDFCGTANTCCEWVDRGDHHRAIGVDRDEEVLNWGVRNNLSQLDPDQQERIELLTDDVRQDSTPPADIVLAMNFSYYIFDTREALRGYFAAVRQGLKSDGVFFLDAYGGYDAYREIVEHRECDGFTYTWEQASYNPIDGIMTCRIHFEFPDGSRLKDAFTYRWRLWSLPEITELLVEAGFSRVTVHWEGTDPESGEGNGVYLPATAGDADPGWICYVVAEP